MQPKRQTLGEHWLKKSVQSWLDENDHGVFNGPVPADN